MTEDNAGTGPRRIAVVSDLAGLHKAIREWVAELNVSRATIDHVGGLPDGHASKLLAPAPLKHFGHVSLGLMLGACGLDLWVIVNDEKLQQLGSRLTRRQSKRWMLANGKDDFLIVKKVSYGELVRRAKAGGLARALRLPPWKRKQIARRAARARWRRNNQPS
jgi:hypothetical protein